MPPTGAKLIEWGHKLGFCYIAEADNFENITTELTALAEHIAATRQLLCSSCQMIFLNTKDKTDLHNFCSFHLPPERRGIFSELFARCGVTRITTAGNMSAYFSGEAHDGEYALRRYVQTADIEL